MPVAGATNQGQIIQKGVAGKASPSHGKEGEAQPKDSMNLENVQLDLYVEDEIFHAEEIKSESEKITALCERRLAELRFTQEELSSPEWGPDMESIIASDNAFSVGVKSRMESLYAAIVRKDSSLWRDMTTANTKKFAARARETLSSAEAKYVDGCIIVRIPLLASKYASGPVRQSKKSGDHGPGPVRFSHVFVEDVRAAMRALVKDFSPGESQNFREKTVTCIFVYPGSSRHFADSDNHDTKAVIDAVVAFLPGQDDAMSCDFAFKTIATDEVPSDTYIIVSPGRETETRVEDFKKMALAFGG